MFERPKSGETAVLVHVDFAQEDTHADLTEFKELARSAGARVVASITSLRQAPDPKYFVGSGKAEEIRSIVFLERADLVLVNHTLTPSQERNLERLCQCRVVDRTGLILDIFAARAQTFEGKLQVELAQLQHLSTRLVRGWTHLERQKGGIGLRGPGETQLETDRRLLRIRIKAINKRLSKVRMQRDQGRRARRRQAIPTVSLVGYTNAGKSTLFNRITGADVYAANQLFATLDPTLRRMSLPGASTALLADTVGFISHLPHDLVEAFRATLEETRDASLLLHVIDMSHPEYRDDIEHVNEVLQAIGAQDVPQIQVYNKIDVIDGACARVEYDAEGKAARVWGSAQTGEGLDELRQAIAAHLFGEPLYRSLCLTPNEGKTRAQLYELGAVLSERVDGEGNWLLSVRISRADFYALFPELSPDTE